MAKKNKKRIRAAAQATFKQSKTKDQRQKPRTAGIDFMAGRHLAVLISGFLICITVISMTLQQLNFGLDFTGGTLVEISFSESVAINDIRSHLDESGYTDASVVYYGSEQDILIRLPKNEDIVTGDAIIAVLRDKLSDNVLALKRVEFVGSQVGSELREDGGLALIIALGLVLVYVAFRFQFKFAIGAVVALLHDVVLVFGFFSVMRWSFDLTVLAALLAVIGYSLNDTIVVSDRIRENFYGLTNKLPYDIINISLNQTLVRTLITSLTTLLVLMSLLLLGGAQVSGFATALAIGVVIGTYSSIYVSSNMLLILKLNHDDLLDNQPKVENPI